MRVVVRRLAKTAGWWAVNPDKGTGQIDWGNSGEPGGLANEIPGEGSDDGKRYNGDGPADMMGAVLDDIDLAYRQAWGRPAYPEEIDAVFEFVFRGARKDYADPPPPDTDEYVSWPLNRWVEETAEFAGVTTERLMKLPWETLQKLRQWDIDRRNEGGSSSSDSEKVKKEREEKNRKKWEKRIKSVIEVKVKAAGKTAALVGTDVAEIYAISPEQLSTLIEGGRWAEEWPEDPFAADKLIRQHGGAVFHTGADGKFDVKIPDREGSLPIVAEFGYMEPYGTKGYDEAIKKVAKFEWQTGDGSETWIGFRIPAPLCNEFPDLGPEDKSPPHITFLYAGKVDPARTEEFLATIRDSFRWVPTVRANFLGLDYFTHADKNRRVAINQVRFDRDLSDIRWRLREALNDRGFDVEDSYPLLYKPHATLEYIDGLDTPYKGHVPRGDVILTEVEVWGMPKVHRVAFGGERRDLSPKRVASLYQKRASQDDLFDPRFNLRECCKHLILLEDHLAHPHKRCNDCINKHLLAVEAFAEEGVALQPGGPLSQLLGQVASTARAAQGSWLANQDSEGLGAVLRKLRKFLVPLTWATKMARMAKTFTVNVGDPVLTGKFQNSPGIVRGFDKDDKGNPLVIVQKGKEGDGSKKTYKLFKIRYDLARAEQMKKKAFDGTRYEVGEEVALGSYRDSDRPDVAIYYSGVILGPPDHLRETRDSDLQVEVHYSDGTKVEKVDPDTVMSREEWLEAHLGQPFPKGRVEVPSKTADLMPPLGYPGGPCHVVQRIDDQVRNPRVKDNLTDQVQDGKSLSNPSAAKVYRLEKERGPGGPIKQILIGPHAQYRMDLRGVTVTEVRLALKRFTKQLNDWKSRKDFQYEHFITRFQRGESYEYTDPGLKLTVVFAGHGRDTAKIVTTYWKGQPDPPPPGACLLPSPSRVAARYKNKKEVPKADGKGTTTVYEYGPRQVANRNKEKAQRVEKLRKNIGKLRSQVRQDLMDSDEAKRLTALAVALIDNTFERVGNPESAKQGHFGVTGWLVKHVTIGKSKATLKYVGKSGVKQEKTIDDAGVVLALREAIADKGKGDKICSGTDCEIGASDVNAYLKPFGVTAKDLRGFHANTEMQRFLKEERKGSLPDDKKKREDQLKKEFDAALEKSAKAVGHEASTLRSQYLVPGLEEAFLKDGTVDDSLVKKAGEDWWYRPYSIYSPPGVYAGTKSDGDKEDDNARKLIKKEPKKKPPRRDLRKRRLDDTDPDIEPQGAENDPDLSLNWKKVSAIHRMADFWLRRRQVLAGLVAPDKKPKADGDYWSPGDGKYSGMANGVVQTFDNPESAKDYASGKKKEEDDKEPKTEKEEKEKEKAEREEAKKQEQLEKKRKERRERAISEMNDKVSQAFEQMGIEGMSSAVQKDLKQALEQIPDGEGKAAWAFEEHVSKLIESDIADAGFTNEAIERASKALSRTKYDGKDPEKLGRQYAELVFAQIVSNPSLLAAKPVSSTPKTPEALQERAEQAHDQYMRMPSELRAEAAKQLVAQMKNLKEDSPEYQELAAIGDGLHLAAVQNDERLEVGGKELRSRPTPRLRALLKQLGPEAGKHTELLHLDHLTSPKGRKQVRQHMDKLEPEEVVDFVGGTEGPFGQLAGLVNDPELSTEHRELALKMLKGLAVDEMTVAGGFLQRAAKGNRDRGAEKADIREQVEKGKGKGRKLFDEDEEAETEEAKAEKEYREWESREEKKKAKRSELLQKYDASKAKYMEARRAKDRFIQERMKARDQGKDDWSEHEEEYEKLTQAVEDLQNEVDGWKAEMEAVQAEPAPEGAKAPPSSSAKKADEVFDRVDQILSESKGLSVDELRSRFQSEMSVEDELEKILAEDKTYKPQTPPPWANPIGKLDECLREGGTYDTCIQKVRKLRQQFEAWKDEKTSERILAEVKDSPEMKKATEEMLEAMRGDTLSVDARAEVERKYRAAYARSVQGAAHREFGELSPGNPAAAQMSQVAETGKVEEFDNRWESAPKKESSWSPRGGFFQSRFYTAGHICGGRSHARVSPSWNNNLPRRNRTMANDNKQAQFKLTAAVAMKIGADFDKVANLVTHMHEVLGIPEKIAMDYARRTDYLSSLIERNAGLDPRNKQALTEDPNLKVDYPVKPGFDPEEIGEEVSGTLEGDADEKSYMGDNFSQQENRELRERQEGGDLAKLQVIDDEQSSTPGRQATLDETLSKFKGTQLRTFISQLESDYQAASGKLGGTRRGDLRSIAGGLAYIAHNLGKAASALEDDDTIVGNYTRQGIQRVAAAANEVLPHVQGDIAETDIPKLAQLVDAVADILAA